MRKNLKYLPAAIAIIFVFESIVMKTYAQTTAYETSLFSVRYPAGAQIELKNEYDGGTNSGTHYYRGRLPHHSWADVTITDFSGVVLPEDHTEIILSKRSVKLFATGVSASPITKTILGGLLGYQQAIHGQILNNSDLSLVVRWRLAVSHTRSRVWILQTISPSDQDLSEADCERFFDSLKIK
jgi:hypothetical protein